MLSKYFIILTALFVLAFSPNVDATGVFPIIELDKDFNSASIQLSLYNPPTIFKNCLNVSNGNASCSQQFALILPQWVEPYEGGHKIYELRRFAYYHPRTSAKLIEDCMKFSADSEFSVRYAIGRGTFEPKESDKEFQRTFFDWNLDPGGSECYQYNIPIYNPQLVEQNNTKYYPFDSYTMEYGFLFPYRTDLQGFVIIPEEFTITSFFINMNQKIEKAMLVKNKGYFNIKADVNKAQMLSIKFSRIPDTGRQFLTGFIIFGLPIFLLLLFLYSPTPRVDQTKATRINTVYLAILPLFISMISFLNDKPNIFTLFDALMTLSVGGILLNATKDFLYPEKFENKPLRWMCVVLLFIIVLLSW